MERARELSAPAPKGPDNPADAVNAALDLSQARQRPQADADVRGSDPLMQEPGDQEGPYARWPVSGVTIAGKGRGVVAARPLAAGCVTYQAEPWIAVVADSFLRTVCAHCFKKTENDADLSHSCPACSAVGYCSAECQAAATGLHERECASVAAVVRMTAGKADSRGARMLIRALAQRSLDLEGAPPAADRAAFSDIEMLEDHLNDIPPPKQKEFLSIAAGVGGLPVAAGVGKVELVRLVAALRCNSQGLVDVENQRRGDVLIAPADFNHSWSVPCLD